MDQSHSESDVSLSPSQILERLQVLKQLQLLQRGKLQKQRLQYQESPETSSSITEIVSQFSSTASYNTFCSLLHSQPESNDATPRSNSHSQMLKEQDLIEGVSVLNLSQECELIVTSPVSSGSRLSVPSMRTNSSSPLNQSSEAKSLAKKQIALEEMPILSPKLDFEALVTEKLKNENKSKVKPPPNKGSALTLQKKPFLRRGEGMTRFGLRKNDLIIQNTKSLPWRQKGLNTKTISHVSNTNLQPINRVKVQPAASQPQKPMSKTNVKFAPNLITMKEKSHTCAQQDDNKEISVDSTKCDILENKPDKLQMPQEKHALTVNKGKSKPQKEEDNKDISIDTSTCELHNTNKPEPKIQLPRGKHPLTVNKGKTWAAVLTKEQDDFLRQLKQSDYYKNFVSPAKSTVSDISCDDHLTKLRQEREAAEQNMFNLLENKVCNESFNLESTFFDKFLKRSHLECSGESTPLIMQKCLAKNPELMHIFPDVTHRKRNESIHSDIETCNSEYTDCSSDACSSVSSCCSCKTIEAANNSTSRCVQTKESTKKNATQKDPIIKTKKVVEKAIECQDDTTTENDTMKANMAEMNAQLVATSELLKDRLRELEDEIETFRKENLNLTKLRDEVDMERQKFYEEKNTFEQKFNEEKILSEYYLAEEKEKLNQQKRMYERYLREMRGRVNKKEKDEVINLKKAISDLKDEIRIKDAKSTSTIARLRNQLKIMEKEKKDLQDGIEKLKKENRRIQHSNDITRRLTNVKYLEEINKKLTNMSSKDTRSEARLDSDMKYKVFEIERQSRSRKMQPVDTGTSRPRAKSVPNLKVTSRYAKYFSQKDAVSETEKNYGNVEQLDSYTHYSDDEDEKEINNLNDTESNPDNDDLSDNEENNLEKIYMERFQSTSPASSKSSLTTLSINNQKFNENPDGFFIRKSNSMSRDSKSPIQTPVSPYPQNISGITSSRSPVSIPRRRLNGHTLADTSSDQQSIPKNLEESNLQRSKSPVSILSNRSSGSQRVATVVNQDPYRDKLMTVSPEPPTSKISVTKTNLKPTEIKKSDGSRELRFPNGNVKHISADGKYSKFIYYNGDVKEIFYEEGRIKYFYAESKTFHTTHPDGLEVLEFPDGQVEKRYKDGSLEIRLPNGCIRYFDPKNEHIREEWRFPDGTTVTVAADGEKRILFNNGQIEVHTQDHKRREFPDGTVKLVYNDGTSETRYASGRVRIKDKHGNLIMDSAPG